MCFPADATPPVKPIAGAAVTNRNLILTAEDGNRLSAFEALTESPGGTAIVVLPDVRGLFRFYEELALRFAEHGYDTVAIDYFGRTAGVEKRTGDWDFRPHVDNATQEGVKADVAAAVAHLRAGGSDRSIFTVGFCFGGSNSWHQSANGHGLAGAVGFYGHPNRPGFPQEAPAMISRVGDVECPILGLMGGADPGIPREEIDAFGVALDTAGVANDLISYPGAPHSFFDRSYEEFTDESADAWERVLSFVATNE